MRTEASTSRLPRLPSDVLEVLEVTKKQEVTENPTATSKTSNGTAWKSISNPLKTHDFQTSKSSTPLRGVAALVELAARYPVGRAKETR